MPEGNIQDRIIKQSLPSEAQSAKDTLHTTDFIRGRLGVIPNNFIDKKGHLNKGGKAFAHDLHETIMPNSHGENYDYLKTATDTIRFEMKDQLQQVRREIRNSLIQEFKADKKKYIGNKDFKDELKRRFDQDSRVANVHIERKILSSLQQTEKASLKKEAREAIKSQVTTAEVDVVREELKAAGKKVPNAGLLKNIVIARKLAVGVQEQQTESQLTNLTNRIKEEQTILNNKITSQLARFRQFTDRTKTQVTHEVLAKQLQAKAAVLNAQEQLRLIKTNIKKNPGLAVLSAVTIANSVVGIGAVPPPSSVQINNHTAIVEPSQFAQEQTRLQAQLEKGQTYTFVSGLENTNPPKSEISAAKPPETPVISVQQPEPVASPVIQQENKQPVVQPTPVAVEAKVNLPSASQPIQVSSALSAELTKPVELKNINFLNNTSTEYKGFEGARKLIIPTPEEFKKLAKEGKISFDNNHPIVITEAEYLSFWAKQTPELRAKLLEGYAVGIVQGLEKVYVKDNKLVVVLEGGHLSVAPPGKSTQDTGTAAIYKDSGQSITEKTLNVELNKLIVKMITQKYSNWIPVVNADEKGFLVDQISTYPGSEFYIRCTDAEMLMRVVWEKMAKDAKANGFDFVRIATHFNGAEGDPRGGITIPPIAGDYREKSLEISRAIAQSLTDSVRKIMPEYLAEVRDIDEVNDPYAITDAADDNLDYLKIYNNTDPPEVVMNKLRSKASRSLFRLVHNYTGLAPQDIKNS